MPRALSKLLLSLTVALAPGLAQAQAMSDVEFSATMVQRMPQQDRTMETKIYVGDGVMRSEMKQDDKERVTIVDTSERTAYLLNPAKKEYLKMEGGGQGQQPRPQAGMSRPPLPDEPGSPCQQDNPNFTCERLGAETVNGREAVKWRFEATQGQRTMTSTVWIDQELRMPIRQEMPGGMVSELKNIQVGDQPDSLFRVPDGYTRIEMPARPQQQQGGAPAYGP